MPKMNVKKGDLVQVLSGKDKGKQANVLRAFPSEGKVMVEGVAIVKKATRPTQQNQQGGIVSQEAKIDVSNVMLICPECENKVPNVSSFCNICGHKFEEPAEIETVETAVEEAEPEKAPVEEKKDEIVAAAQEAVEEISQDAEEAVAKADAEEA